MNITTGSDGPPEPPEHFDAIEAREHQVEDDESGSVVSARSRPATPVGDDLHGHAFVREIPRDDIAEVEVVLDHEHPRLWAGAVR